MLEMKVRVFGLRLAEREQQEGLKARQPFVMLEQVGEDGWNVYFECRWLGGEVERLDVKQFTCTYDAFETARELAMLSNLKICTIEQD